VTVQKLSPRERVLVAQALERRRAALAADAPKPRDRSQPAPLSFSQLRLWFLQQWAPQAPTFNAVRAFRLRGELDLAALQGALSALMERHESLRTVYVSEGGAEPHQVVLEHEPLAVDVIDLSAEPPDVREQRLATTIRELAREPFDLAADRMMRATVLRLAPAEHVLLLRLHHIAGDAASTAVMFAELGVLYDASKRGTPNDLPPPPIQFADFAVWQRRRLQGERLAQLSDYWVRQLDGAPPLLTLPTDRPRREVQRHEGAHRRFVLDAAAAERIDALARDERTTMYVVALAAFATLLYRVGGDDDVVIGSPMANRTHAELADVVGFLSNTVALRVRLDGNPSFRELVGRVREVVLGALSHQEMPFEQVVSALRLPRDAGHNPVFQVNFRAQTAVPPLPAMDGLEVSVVAVDIGFSRFDLALELQRAADGVLGYVEYDLDLFDATTIETLVEAYRDLLDQVLVDPDAPILAVGVPSFQRPRGRPGPTRGRRRAHTGDDNT
jgi:hypothetical protein